MDCLGIKIAAATMALFEIVLVIAGVWVSMSLLCLTYSECKKADDREGELRRANPEQWKEDNDQRQREFDTRWRHKQNEKW
jgi:hypothetical protein